MIGRTNAGGGGGLQDTDALLRVQAPAGSVVTITKGATTKTDLGHENADDHESYDYYFIIHQSQFDSVNPWTVTATLGTDAATDTVVIDSADEYDIELSYTLYLYKAGDQSGWTAVGMMRSGSQDTTNVRRQPTLTYNNDNLNIYQAGGSGNGHGIAYYSDLVDLTDFNTLKVSALWTRSSSSGAGAAISIIPQNADQWQTDAVAYQTLTINVTEDITIDVSNITGSFYVGVGVLATSTTSSTVKVYSMYLIK